MSSLARHVARLGLQLPLAPPPLPLPLPPLLLLLLPPAGAIDIVASRVRTVEEDQHKLKHFWRLGEGFEGVPAPPPAASLAAAAANGPPAPRAGSASDYVEYVVWLLGVIGVLYFLANPVPPRAASGPAPSRRQALTSRGTCAERAPELARRRARRGVERRRGRRGRRRGGLGRSVAAGLCWRRRRRAARIIQPGHVQASGRAGWANGRVILPPRVRSATQAFALFSFLSHLHWVSIARRRSACVTSPWWVYPSETARAAARSPADSRLTSTGSTLHPVERARA